MPPDPADPPAVEYPPYVPDPPLEIPPEDEWGTDPDDMTIGTG